MSASVTTSADLTRLMRSEVAALHEYQPVPTPESVATRLGISLSEIVKLDANENPFGPPPAVRALLASAPPVERYPDPDALLLRAALGRHVGAPVESIVAGNGSDELIDLLCRIFVSPGDRVITCEPTFGVYRFAASQLGAKVIDVPRNDLFDVDGPALLAALDGSEKLVFLCSPNNPSGNPLAEALLRQVLESTAAPVVVDEAYAEFEGKSFIRLMDMYPNLIILRTLSKYAGLAGLRVGYGVFPTPVASALWKVKPPYNVNIMAQAAGVAALSDTEWLEKHMALQIAARVRLTSALTALPGVIAYESATNFVLFRFAETEGPRTAQAIYDYLLSRGILVRRLSAPKLAQCLRISAGTPEQIERVIGEVKSLWN